MSPLGKSGKYYMNPHEMKRKGDEPNPPNDAAAPGENGDGGHEDGGDANGDGAHHHELHEDKDAGMLHSVHTHPDGRVEEADHDSYGDAKDHMDQMMGEGGDGEEEPDGDEDGGPKMPPDMSSADDMAGMYEKAGRRG